MVPDDAIVTLGPAPEEPTLPIAFPPGVRVVRTGDQARLPSRALLDPAAVLVVWDDGTTFLLARADGREVRVWIADPTGERSAWTERWPPDAVTRVDGRWILAQGAEVEVREPDGALVTTVTVPCAGVAYPVDGALRGVGPTCSWTVDRDGVVGDGTATIAFAGGVLDLDGTTVALGGVWTAFSSHGPGLVSASPNGRFVLAGDQVLDARTGVPTARGVWRGWSDDSLLLGLNDASWARYDPADGHLIGRTEGHVGPVGALAWSADSRELVSVGASDGAVLWWSVAGGPPLARLEPRDPVRSVVFAGPAVLTVGGRTERWIPGQPLTTLDGAPAALSDGRVALFGADDVTILDPAGEAERTWKAPIPRTDQRGARISQVTVLRGRVYAVSGGRLWDLDHDDAPVALGVAWTAPSPDGRALLLCDGVRTIGSWPPGHPGNAPGCDPAAEMGLSQPLSVVSPDGRLRAVPDPDGVIQVFPAHPTTVDDRGPRDLVVLAVPANFVDPKGFAVDLAAAHARGDRVTWVVPGTPDPPWIRVGARSAARDLAALGSIPAGDESLQDALCRAQARLEPGRPGLVVISPGSSSSLNLQRCARGREADVRFSDGSSALAVLAAARAGW